MSPSRLPLMETSENNATSSPSSTPDASLRRRSGRVVRAPRKFSPDTYPSQNGKSAPKRKRATDLEEDEDEENQAPDGEQVEGDLTDEEDNDEEEEPEDDDDEPAPRSKKSKPSRSSRPKKPATKRAKVNGDALTINASAPSQDAPAVRLPNRPKKTARIAVARLQDDGLYAEIFGSGDSTNDVASHWFQRYQANDAEALTDLINCVLLAAGCDQKLTEDDIRDPENSANRLSELEEAYEQTSISDYPLISRAKGSKNFRDLLIGFFDSLISLLHQTDFLYTDEELLENIQRWVGIMSSSALRPFRHTATTVGLAMLTALISVTKQLDDRITKSNQALQAESNRRGKNKNLVASTQKALDGANQNREFVDAKSKDLFDIIFVHRYRDIDPKIRAESIEALGNWICTLPTVYMAPEYLRYLGWLLSDVAVSTRLEVLKQLARVLKRDAEKLAHFIDRFRPRLVEMATKDADIGVRVAAVAVVDILRSSGMLEPEEMDTISKLIFDSEVRIRRAVAGFFSEVVRDYINQKIDDIGGSDVLDEVFGDEEEDNYDSLRRDWMDIKALAEHLASCDSQLDTEQDEIRHGLDVAADVVNADVPESRVAQAAQVLYEKIPEISNWQVLAGYLLFDHTTSAATGKRSKTITTEAAIKKAVAPQPREEAILLEVLASAVKESLISSAEHDRHRRKGVRVDSDAQEDAGMQLAGIIPQLLNKFGSDPAMAATVLRLEHYLDLDVFQQLRQNSATYDTLLDEVTVQFNRHVDQAVLNEARTAFIHARQYEELEELVDSKLAAIWDNSLNALRAVEKSTELSVRGNLDRAQLTDLSRILMKISKLTSVSDCVDVLEAPGTSADSDQPAIKTLIDIVGRGSLHEPNDELDDPEDETVSFAIKCCLLYFMWKVRRLQNAIENNEDIPNIEVDQLIVWRKDLVQNLIQTFSSRGFNDDLRLMAVGVACDIGSLLVFLRDVVHSPRAPRYGKLRALLEEMPHQLITEELIPIFDAAERAYAKRTGKHLNDPVDDEDPLDLDDELPPEDDEDEEVTEQERHAAALKAEKILCELASKYVLAIIGKVIDNSGPNAGKLRKRLNRNKTKLGPSYKEVVAYLDENHLRSGGAGRKKAPPAAAKGKGKEGGEATTAASTKKAPISAELVLEEDDIDDPFEEDVPEEGTAEDLKRRELLEDPIEEPEDDEEEEAAPPASGDGGDQMEEDDDIIGD